jgi:hypothetical protein
MLFPLPRRLFRLWPHGLDPALPTGLHTALTEKVRARYPGAIVQAAEYDIWTDSFVIAVLHASFPLATGPAAPTPWDNDAHEAPQYHEPTPCGSADPEAA